MEFQLSCFNPKRWCCESAALNRPANLENSAVATGLEKVSFHSKPKEKQCQRMLKTLPFSHQLWKTTEYLQWNWVAIVCIKKVTALPPWRGGSHCHSRNPGGLLTPAAQPGPTLKIELIPEDRLEWPLHPGVAVATLHSQAPGGGGEWEVPGWRVGGGQTCVSTVCVQQPQVRPGWGGKPFPAPAPSPLGCGPSGEAVPARAGGETLTPQHTAPCRARTDVGRWVLVCWFRILMLWHWGPKNWCFRAVVLEKTLEGPLDCKEIQPVYPKGDQSWVFIDAEAETPTLWPRDAKNYLIGKAPDAGKDWRQEEKGTTEDEMVGWHPWLSGHEFE